MKKTRFLAMTLVVAIMMMGAGYAYWSQDLTINNTVDTGVLEVNFAEPAAIEEEDLPNQPLADMSINGNKATITFIDVFPGVENLWMFNLQNDGTLKAFVRDFEIANNQKFGDRVITDIILVDDLKVGEDEIGDDYTLATALEALNNYSAGYGVPVESGEKIQVSMKLTFDPEATEAEMPEDDVLTFDITAGVHQFNEVIE